MRQTVLTGPSRLARYACLLLVAGLLGGCAGSGGGYLNGDAPLPRRLDPSKIQNAVPRDDPIRAAGNKSPYTVLGKTYHVMHSARGYVATGTASWYGRKFHGRRTADGEIYDAYAMTAAHKTLPIPSYVKVTNLDNGKTAIVRVNDRGPFHGNRLIDLSYAAATKLGFVDKGTAHVRIQAIDPDTMTVARRSHQPATRRSNQPAARRSKAESGSTRSVAVSGEGRPYLQAGAFSKYPSAEALRRKLEGLIDKPVSVSATQSGQQTYYRVRIGPLRDRAEAEAIIPKLLLHNLGVQLVYR